MSKTHTYTSSSDGSSSRSVTSTNRLGSHTSTVSTRRTRDGFVTSRSESSTSNSGSVFVIIKIVAIAILTLSLFSVIFGHNTFFGFGTLLEAIAEVPTLDLDSFTTLVQIPRITGDWGVFDFLRGVINLWSNTFNNLFSFVCFLGFGFVQVWSLVFYFLGLV